MLDPKWQTARREGWQHMHVFIDESGGYGQRSLVVAALVVEPRSVRRALKRFRRRHPVIQSETKGHKLSAQQREDLVGLLESCFVLSPVCVHLDVTKPLGSWAKATQPEGSIWNHLIVEALENLPMPDEKIDVTIDHPRHGRRGTAELTQLLHVAQIDTWPVTCVDSRLQDEIQAADVVANTAFRSLCVGHTDAADATRALAALGVRLVSAELRYLAPAWLRSEEAAPEGGF